MSGFKLDNFNDRLTAAAKAKEALLEKFRAGKQPLAAGADAMPADAMPVDDKPSDAKPSDAKPSDAKSSDAKSSDAKPVRAQPAATVPSGGHAAAVGKKGQSAAREGKPR